MKESLPLTLYNCANVDSTNELAAPNRAMTHIQNTAPGPPTAMAVATPARLPVPTRLAIEMANAWNEEICFSPGFPFVPAESPSKRTISPIMRNCTKRVFSVNQRAHPKSRAMRI